MVVSLFTACVVRFRDLLRGPCFWSLELEITHCYFDFVNTTRPNDNIVIVPLNKLLVSRVCRNCTEIAHYFNVPHALEYLVAGQQMTLCTGELSWSLDHTQKRSLIAPITSINSRRLNKALNSVADARGLRICSNSESLPYLCQCPQ